MTQKNIFLIGFMGAGKSTVARCLSRELGAPLVEMDERIAADEGMPITQIFETHGEEYFRRKETALIRSMDGQAQVVSCGGGVAMRQENVESMKANGTVVFLTATPQTIYERVKDSTERPLLNGHMDVAYIAELMEKRRPAYENAADFLVETDGRAKEEIAAEILCRIGEAEET